MPKAHMVTEASICLRTSFCFAVLVLKRNSSLLEVLSFDPGALTKWKEALHWQTGPYNGDRQLVAFYDGSGESLTW